MYRCAVGAELFMEWDVGRLCEGTGHGERRFIPPVGHSYSAWWAQLFRLLAIIGYYIHRMGWESERKVVPLHPTMYESKQWRNY